MILPCHIHIVFLPSSTPEIRSRPLLLWSLAFGPATFKMACVDRMTRYFAIRAYHLVGSSVHRIWGCGRPGFSVMMDHQDTLSCCCRRVVSCSSRASMVPWSVKGPDLFRMIERIVFQSVGRAWSTAMA